MQQKYECQFNRLANTLNCTILTSNKISMKSIAFTFNAIYTSKTLLDAMKIKIIVRLNLQILTFESQSTEIIQLHN